VRNRAPWHAIRYLFPMMRIALISPLFESVPPRYYGGTERVVHQLCQGLTEAGIEVTLFASGDSRTQGELLPVIPQALRLAHPPIKDSLPYNLKMLADVASRAREFDVIHNHHDYWMLPLSEMSDTPLVTTLHGRLDLPYIAAAFKSYPKAHYVSISNAQRWPMPALSWAKTILHGIDAESYRFQPEPGKYLAFLGRMSLDKRPDWAIDIAQKSGVPLKMAAKIEGAADQEYFDKCVKPRIDGRFIEYVGEICEAEKSDFLGNALAMVFPIDWPEPFGLVMPESLACGTPVLARPCGSVTEVLKDGITGFIDADIQTLADRVRDLARIDRRACRQWVEERFSLKRMTEEYIDVYRNLATGAPARAAGHKAVADVIELVDRRADRRRRDLIHPLQRTADGDHQTFL
jgi:glycosyltransferase involved in cell wall biosynthesis